jgi:hypothetical protein
LLNLRWVFTLQVSARFIRDLEKFNEWMNEEDYITAKEQVPSSKHVNLSPGSALRVYNRQSSASHRQYPYLQFPNTIRGHLLH